jgi:hypothetical protein
MDWFSYLMGFLTALLLHIVLFFSLPILQVPRDKFVAWIFKKEKIKTRRDKDRRNLDKIMASLRNINQLPSSPDTPIDTIKDYLFKIERIAKEIKTKDFERIRDELLKYSYKSGKLHQNMKIHEILKSLVRCEGCSLDLHKEVSEILSHAKRNK